VRGKGIYDNAPITVESFTAQTYGDRPFELDLVYQDDANVAQDLADYVKTQYLALANQADVVTINPQRSDALMVHALAREIGDRITVSETMTGLDGTDLTIQGIELEVREGPWLLCRWTVAPSLSTAFWILDDPVASVLDETTVLGYV
jgi:hypothetical protein